MIQMSLLVGNEESKPLETAVLVNSIADLMRWIFLIVCAIGLIAIYIKKKNANSGLNKHS